MQVMSPRQVALKQSRWVFLSKGPSDSDPLRPITSVTSAPTGECCRRGGLRHHTMNKTLYTVDDLLSLYATEACSKEAIVDGNRSLTYCDLLNHCLCFANVLKERGVRPGDRVCLFLPRSMESVISFFAAQLLGAVVVFVNDVLKAKQVNHILAHSGASHMISNDRLIGSTGIQQLDPDAILSVDDVQFSEGSCRPTRSPAIGNDLALIIYTSGSTGLPKGIMLSHNNLLSGTHIVSDYLNLTADDVLISLLPFSFDYGLNQLLTSLRVGATLVIQKSLFPPDICRTLAKRNITGMAAVPMLWQQLMGSHSPFCNTVFPRLRYLTNTGGRLPGNVVRRLRTCHPNAELYLMYGLTEAFRSTYLEPSLVDSKPDSIGQAVPNVSILVCDDHGGICEADEVGMLVHRGANIALGYWQDPEATDHVFRMMTFDSNGVQYHERVVFSGDLVKKDKEGDLYFVGRKDQMMKSHGIRLSPEEVEEVLYSSGLLVSAVVFDAPGEGPEQDIIAAVIPKNPDSFSADELLGFCKAEMPQYMIPHRIVTCESFPSTSTGKPDRRRIGEMYVEEHRSIQQAV